MHNATEPVGLVKAIFAPSGDQLPGQPNVPISDTPLPSTFINASTFPPPNRSVENAILVPSGDQTGDQSAPGSLVSRTRAVPSRLMTQTSRWWGASARAKAIRAAWGVGAG